MKLIKKIFSRQPKVFYSCVIDNDPKFYRQGYVFIISLIKIANISGDRIFVHMTAKNDEFERFLYKHKVNIKYIEPWGDKKYCNKLQQLETEELKKADFVFFCDADIAITQDLVHLIKDKNTVLGKLVDFDNPDVETLKYIYDKFKVFYPKVTTETLNQNPTFETNFNGGLYGIPTKFIDIFIKQWKNFAREMLESEKIKERLGKKVNHIDQISFSLALKSLKLKYKLLSYEYNCPIHLKDFSLLKTKIKTDVKVIHYHSNLSKDYFIKKVDISCIDKKILDINKVLVNAKKDFND